ncbi:hypothetical protein NE237_022983 [Protea cynaroides]|uniref:CCHC-type domain-containing protein n=1 Tax=Protea cynaroides TaxID=273540 RepID=A0A9Q0HC05_9MAGN|nr:hypothetical protein NE237_022983 [Protea cynaroides]
MVKFERLLLFCYECGRLGHNYTRCDLLFSVLDSGIHDVGIYSPDVRGVVTDQRLVDMALSLHYSKSAEYRKCSFQMSSSSSSVDTAMSSNVGVGGNSLMSQPVPNSDSQHPPIPTAPFNPTTHDQWAASSSQSPTIVDTLRKINSLLLPPIYQPNPHP